MVGRQHLVQGWTFENEDERLKATEWSDIVDYFQTITITQANTAVSPIDLLFYFND